MFFEQIRQGGQRIAIELVELQIAGRLVIR